MQPLVPGPHDSSDRKQTSDDFTNQRFGRFDELQRVCFELAPADGAYLIPKAFNEPRSSFSRSTNLRFSNRRADNRTRKRWLSSFLT